MPAPAAATEKATGESRLAGGGNGIRTLGPSRKGAGPFGGTRTLREATDAGSKRYHLVWDRGFESACSAGEPVLDREYRDHGVRDQLLGVD